MAKPKTILIPDDRGRHLMPVVWGLVVLVILVGVFWLSYRISPGNHPAEYEGVVVDKWASYSETDDGSVPHFRLLVELTDGQKLTIRVGPDLYNEAKVGSRIRKSSKGIEVMHSPQIKMGFASKVMCHLDFGFAAICEAVALPRRPAEVI